MTLALTGIAMIAYYGLVVRLVGEPAARRLSRHLADGTKLGLLWTYAQVDAATRLSLAALMQLGFVILLGGFLALQWQEMWSGNPLMWLLAIAVGVTEAALATWLAFVVTRVAEAVRPKGSPTTVQEWAVIARAGWVRYYARSAERAPRWFLLLATAVYVGGEEIAFRAIVINLLEGDPVAAVAVSTALFMLVQVFYMPSWRAMLFPVTGALVVGLVHANLFLASGDLAFLIVAHVAFFYFSAL